MNVPPGLMTDRDFPRRVAEALRRHGLGADRLLLEITEDALLGETAVAEVVAERLHQFGVHLWLDDFGTGYSSLLSLRQIPLQAVKIDIAFVANIHTDPSAEQFMRALLALGRDLDLLVTAEGVESILQADILRSLGCQYVQGYLYARPAPAAELEHLLAAWRSSRHRLTSIGNIFDGSACVVELVAGPGCDGGFAADRRCALCARQSSLGDAGGSIPPDGTMIFL